MTPIKTTKKPEVEKIELQRIVTLRQAIINLMDNLSDLNLAFIQLLTELGYELGEDGMIKKVNKHDQETRSFKTHFSY